MKQHAAKLEQMHEFGFFDPATNLRALEITEGNVEVVISNMIEGGDMIIFLLFASAEEIFSNLIKKMIKTLLLKSLQRSLVSFERL